LIKSNTFIDDDSLQKYFLYNQQQHDDNNILLLHNDPDYDNYYLQQQRRIPPIGSLGRSVWERLPYPVMSLVTTKKLKTNTDDNNNINTCTKEGNSISRVVVKL
jgi:hypothetical protein